MRHGRIGASASLLRPLFVLRCFAAAAAMEQVEWTLKATAISPSATIGSCHCWLRMVLLGKLGPDAVTILPSAVVMTDNLHICGSPIRAFRVF